MSKALSIHPSPARLLVVAGVILAPWTAWLVVSLPSTQTAHHWDLAWAGFDVALAAALVAAGLALGNDVAGFVMSNALLPVHDSSGK